MSFCVLLSSEVLPAAASWEVLRGDEGRGRGGAVSWRPARAPSAWWFSAVLAETDSTFAPSSDFVKRPACWQAGGAAEGKPRQWGAGLRAALPPHPPFSSALPPPPSHCRRRSPQRPGCDLVGIGGHRPLGPSQHKPRGGGQEGRRRVGSVGSVWARQGRSASRSSRRLGAEPPPGPWLSQCPGKRGLSLAWPALWRTRPRAICGSWRHGGPSVPTG